MTRARVELAIALGAALSLLAGLAGYEGPSMVADTTLLAGPLSGTVQDALPAEEASAIHIPNRSFAIEEEAEP